ncbi:hypothetical protein K504DRAFT_534211 [Pleomassaria siparia CBS 279.74]|uniref:Mid2 domain-containing protein n=1 Tax=Pleomassaria siparia CBS 279.74 TaxID=1314801 RepID=A0A6G1K6T4_9PLEO|nr:hypothetical protein K504DRAFT_534211 [Pleomassaria siparia CBS 279.74]
MDFINPPPAGVFGDFSENPIYNVGSKVRVAWTPPTNESQAVSVTLSQMNGTQWILPAEYLTQSAIGRTSYDWLVVTEKNLSVSNMFILAVFREGNSSPDAITHYFNISEKAVAPTSSASKTSFSTASISTSVPSSAAGTSTIISTTTPTSLVPFASSSPASDSSTASSRDFSMGTRIGLGVSIPVALIVGLAAGLFLFKRYSKRNKTPAISPNPPGDHHDAYTYHGNYTHGGYYGSTVELPPKSPTEMPQVNAYQDNGARYDTQNTPGGDTTVGPSHHELPSTGGK